MGAEMKLLLDTCSFIWMVSSPAKLSPVAVKALNNAENEIILSLTSVLEITLKWQAGKLTFPDKPEVWVPSEIAKWKLATREIDAASIFCSGTLPPIHKDPFDRLLVGLAVTQRLTIVTPDTHISSYKVSTLW